MFFEVNLETQKTAFLAVIEKMLDTEFAFFLLMSRKERKNFCRVCAGFLGQQGYNSLAEKIAQQKTSFSVLLRKNSNNPLRKDTIKHSGRNRYIEIDFWNLIQNAQDPDFEQNKLKLEELHAKSIEAKMQAILDIDVDELRSMHFIERAEIHAEIDFLLASLRDIHPQDRKKFKVFLQKRGDLIHSMSMEEMRSLDEEYFDELTPSEEEWLRSPFKDPLNFDPYLADF